MNSTIEKPEAIKTFLQARSFALIGVSRNEKKFSNNVFKELIAKGWKIYPVNPAMETLGDYKCYPSLSSLPEPAEAVITMVSKDKTPGAVQQAIDSGVKLIWIHQKTDTPDVIKLCADNNITYITGECIMMFADPIGSFHKFHRWINKVIGKYPN